MMPQIYDAAVQQRHRYDSNDLAASQWSLVLIRDKHKNRAAAKEKDSNFCLIA